MIRVHGMNVAFAWCLSRREMLQSATVASSYISSREIFGFAHLFDTFFSCSPVNMHVRRATQLMISRRNFFSLLLFAFVPQATTMRHRTFSEKENSNFDVTELGTAKKGRKHTKTKINDKCRGFCLRFSFERHPFFFGPDACVCVCDSTAYEKHREKSNRSYCVILCGVPVHWGEAEMEFMAELSKSSSNGWQMHGLWIHKMLFGWTNMSACVSQRGFACLVYTNDFPFSVSRFQHKLLFNFHVRRSRNSTRNILYWIRHTFIGRPIANATITKRKK